MIIKVFFFFIFFSFFFFFFFFFFFQFFFPYRLFNVFFFRNRNMSSAPRQV